MANLDNAVTVSPTNAIPIPWPGIDFQLKYDSADMLLDSENGIGLVLLNGSYLFADTERESPDWDSEFGCTAREYAELVKTEPLRSSVEKALRETQLTFAISITKQGRRLITMPNIDTRGVRLDDGQLRLSMYCMFVPDNLWSPEQVHDSHLNLLAGNRLAASDLERAYPLVEATRDLTYIAKSAYKASRQDMLERWQSHTSYQSGLRL